VVVETEADDVKPADAPTADVQTEETDSCTRKVSRHEGEQLSRKLLLNVPFVETSAKTGANVEEAFEGMVRAVLREMGREVGGGPAAFQKCRRKNGHRKETWRTAERGANTDEVWPEVVLAEPRRPSRSSRQAPRPRLAVDTGFDEVAVESGGESPVTPTTPRKRRESVLDRFRKVFTKKTPVMVGNVPS
jgi:hypothetical protein